VQAKFSEQIYVNRLSGGDHTVVRALFHRCPPSSLAQNLFTHILLASQARYSSSALTPATNHTSTFPPSIAHLVRSHHLRRLTLSLTRGHWTHPTAGLPWTPAPPGLELAVQFDASVPDVRTELKALAQALGGLTAAAVGAGLQHGAITVPAVGWFGGTAVQRCVRKSR
jgi:Gpi16 subunit, GPI transamidase component